MLESANMILFWNRLITTDKTVDFRRPDIVLIDRENKTAREIHREVALTYNLPKTETEKITKYENLVLEIKNMWKLTNVSVDPPVISAEGVVTKILQKYLDNTGLTKTS